MSNKVLHFDGDAIIHVIASAAERRYIVVTHKDSGTTKEFENRSEFWGRSKKRDGGWLASLNATREAEGKQPFTPEDFEIADKQEAEPVENCLHSVKLYIEGICNKLKCNNYKVYIGQGETFRHKILMPQGRRYKQNREDLLRAVLIDEVKTYLLKHHNAEIVTGIEVDDKLSMIAYEGYKKFLKTGKTSDDTNIIVSRDKDTLGTQGWLFNPDNMEAPIYIHGFGKLWLNAKGDVKGVGRKFKYYQILHGDETDGYSGRRVPQKDGSLKLFQYGQKKIYEELKDLETDKECWELIVKKYKEWVPEDLTYAPEGVRGFITDNWLSWLQKHVDFVHMLRWEGDKIRVKDVLDKLKVEYLW